MDKDNLERAVTLRHELHRHPELSCREEWTRQHLIDFLKQHTALEIVDKGRWFYAVYRAGADKPSIAFRADFDALPMDEFIDLPYGSQYPGVSHKCGHDGHSACLAGFALEIDRKGADKNIYFVFQHAEETVEGGAECAPLMEEAGISEVFAYHNLPGIPVNAIIVIDGVACCASSGMTISFKGVPCHASQPEDGRNPAKAVAEIIRCLDSFTEPALYRGLVMCTVIMIDVGKEAFGMSASEGRLLLTIRGEFDEELEVLRQKIEDKAREQADKYGLEYGFSFCDSVPALINHKESVDKVRRAAADMGLVVVEAKAPSRGSEDFAWFTKKTKGAMFDVGVGEDRTQIHTSGFDFNDEIIPTVVDLFTALSSSQ
ncbi:MAG: amidohydrolase [Treponema sp.]|jgi:amidohydrolase|nr:amidohydrolase [Treponema sp.]